MPDQGVVVVESEGSDVSATPHSPRPQPSAIRRWFARVVRFVRSHFFGVAVGLVLVALIGAPIAFLVRMSLATGTSPADPGGYTLNNFRAILDSPVTGSAVVNTAIYSVGVTVASLALAAWFAWLVERTDLPFRNLAWLILLAPLAMPGMLSSMAYTLLLSPRAGIINVAIRDVLSVVGIELVDGPLNIYSMWGMIFVETLSQTTTVFLMIVGAFRLMDPSLEEAAVVSGSGRLGTLRRITIPLMKPVLLAALIYAFVGNLQDFDTPLLLGLPAGIYVLPTLIYFAAYVTPTAQWGTAAAYSTLFVLMMVVLSVVYYRVILRRSGKFSTISGKAYRPARAKLGRLRPFAFGSFLLFGFVSLGLPVMLLLWTSFLPSYDAPSLEALSKVSLDNYRDLFSSSIITKALGNTIVLATVCAVVTMLFAFMVSWAVVRLRVWGRSVMDSMAFLPNAIPAVALGLGLVLLFLSPVASWLHVYGTLLILIIGFMVHYLAYATRVSNGAMSQMGAELEEAGWVSGVRRFRTLMRVTLPILLPTFVAGGLWVFAKVFRNLTLPLVLSSTQTKTFSMVLYETWTQRGDVPLASAMGLLMILALGLLAYGARRVILRGFSEG